MLGPLQCLKEKHKASKILIFNSATLKKHLKREVTKPDLRKTLMNSSITINLAWHKLKIKLIPWEENCGSMIKGLTISGANPELAKEPNKFLIRMDSCLLEMFGRVILESSSSSGLTSSLFAMVTALPWSFHSIFFVKSIISVLDNLKISS